LDGEALPEAGHIVRISGCLTRMAGGFSLRLHPQIQHAAQTGKVLRRGE
jgi:hypothetical protein